MPCAQGWSKEWVDQSKSRACAGAAPAPLGAGGVRAATTFKALRWLRAHARRALRAHADGRAHGRVFASDPYVFRSILRPNYNLMMTK